MERVGVELHDWQIRTYLGNSVDYIISANIHRRHLNKYRQGVLIVDALKRTEQAETAEKLCQVGIVSTEPHKGGRGKVNSLKRKALAAGKSHGIAPRTMQLTLAEAEGKQPKASTRKRRTTPEMQHVQGRTGEQPCRTKCWRRWTPSWLARAATFPPQTRPKGSKRPRGRSLQPRRHCRIWQERKPSGVCKNLRYDYKDHRFDLTAEDAIEWCREELK
jgi:hypothetical protein